MNHNDIEQVAQIIIDSGKTVLGIYETTDFGVEFKKDNSPLTIADHRSHEVICKGLEGLELNGEVLPVLSEEGKDFPYDERREWERFWMIDPLDGTKEFIKRNGEFTINIALVENSYPIAGFVYLPVKDVLYFSSENVGSYVLKEASKKLESGLFMFSKKLTVNSNIPHIVNVVASRSHLNDDTEKFINKLKNKFDQINTVLAGSSIKLCLVAEGVAHVYPRFAPTMEWDTAAAHGVCRYAGVRVTDVVTNQELTYNKENLLNNWFMVSINEKFEEI